MNDEHKKKETLKKIGKSIQFWRKLEGYDQASFSKKLNSVRSYISRLESGHSSISIFKIKLIADILEVSPFTLLSGAPEKDEINTLLALYKDPNYIITKTELEDLYRARLKGKILTRDFYLNMLSIIRSGIYTRNR